VLAALAVSGIAIASASLAGLLISESRPLFGFMGQGYRPAIVIALEAATTILLVAFVVANARVPPRGGRIHRSGRALGHIEEARLSRSSGDSARVAAWPLLRFVPSDSGRACSLDPPVRSG
jgi:hypothetical protein